MHATIKIQMDNDAFADAPATELGRILRKLAERFEDDGPDYVPLMDINGNKVGEFVVLHD